MKDSSFGFNKLLEDSKRLLSSRCLHLTHLQAVLLSQDLSVKYRRNRKQRGHPEVKSCLLAKQDLNRQQGSPATSGVVTFEVRAVRCVP